MSDRKHDPELELCRWCGHIWVCDTVLNPERECPNCGEAQGGDG